MNKLKLDLSTLKVQGFDTTVGPQLTELLDSSGETGCPNDRCGGVEAYTGMMRCCTAKDSCKHGFADSGDGQCTGGCGYSSYCGGGMGGKDVC